MSEKGGKGFLSSGAVIYLMEIKYYIWIITCLFEELRPETFLTILIELQERGLRHADRTLSSFDRGLFGCGFVHQFRVVYRSRDLTRNPGTRTHRLHTRLSVEVLARWEPLARICSVP